MVLAFEWFRWHDINLEILLHDVKSGVVINLGDANNVARLLLFVDMLVALPYQYHSSQASLFIVRPLLPYLLARVEEPSHYRASGSNATKEACPHIVNECHCQTSLSTKQIPTVQ